MSDGRDHKDNLDDGGTENLRGRSIRGGTIVLAFQVVRQVLHIAFIAVLARILDPTHFGLLAMVTAITAFLQVFTILGLDIATIQKKEVSWRQVSTLFWINLAIGIVLAAICAAASPLIAWLYNTPELVNINLWCSLGFIFGAAGIQHRAILTRRMHFGYLGTGELLGMAGGGALGIAMAVKGFGVYALVGQLLAGSLVTTLASWIFTRWTPGLPKRDKAIWEMLGFGGHLTATNMVNYFSRNLDNVLIGWYWGPHHLALYTKAYSLVLLPIQQIIQPINRVAIPVLSKLQNDPERFISHYKKGMQLILTASMPIAALSIVSADKIVLIILGEKWMDSVAIFRALGLAAFLGTTGPATAWVLISLGQTKRLMQWNGIRVVVMAAAMVIGLPFGAIGVGIGVSVAMLLLRYPALRFGFKYSPVKMKDFVAVAWRPAFASLAAGAVAFGLNYLIIPDINVLMNLGVDVALFSTLFVICFALTPRGPRILRELIEIGKEMFSINPTTG